ncbi:MAG: MFS transporter [Alphaproteobacteria bacterium]|nr:MFS transporter [Alphaproteobacteria bacterium]
MTRRVTRRASRLFPADFWCLWSAGLVLSIVRWLETVVVGVVVYRETDSPFLVSLVTMLRLLPMGLFGVFLGAFVERLDRRLTLAALIGLLAVTSAVLATVAALGALQVWHLAVGALANGFGWLTDNPLRRTMMGDSVGRERMPTAMALDIVAQNTARMIGPTVGGIVLVVGGIEGAFALTAGLYLVAVVATLAVRGRSTMTTARAEPVLARVRDGFAAAVADRRLAAVLGVTVVYNLFGWPFTSMIPVIGRDHLGLGPEGVGLLTSVDGVGAFVGALVLAWRLAPRWHAPAYVGGAILYQLGVIAFALSPGVGSAVAALLLTGLAGAAYSTLQATLVYLAAPIEMRPRIMGVLSVCIGTGPLGFLWLGWLANQIGAPAATAITGALGLALLLALRPLWRTI